MVNAEVQFPAAYYQHGAQGVLWVDVLKVKDRFVGIKGKMFIRIPTLSRFLAVSFLLLFALVNFTACVIFSSGSFSTCGFPLVEFVSVVIVDTLTRVLFLIVAGQSQLQQGAKPGQIFWHQ
jgi:hypothetical protein